MHDHEGWTTRATGLGLAAALLLGFAGCGGDERVSDGVVEVEEPEAIVTSGEGAVAATTPASATSSEASKPAETSKPAPTAKVEGWGTLKGRVVFGGAAPEPEILVKQGDPGAKDSAVCAAQPIESQRLVVDPASKGVRYALVYIPRPSAVNPEAESARKAEELVFDQKGCTFVPHVLAAMQGQTVTITSSDPVGHNINPKFTGAPFTNQTINPGTSLPPAEIRSPSGRPGEVVCDIHPWMKAYWLTLNNPYFAVTDEEGNFEIANVPAGTQKVVVWQEAVNYVTSPTGQAIDIAPDGETTQEFTIDPSKVTKG